jgi:hypothetical protein
VESAAPNTMQQITSNQQKQHLIETMASSTTKMKKKPAKKLAKPITRSSSQQFKSHAAEVNALARALENHLEKNVTDEDIPQHERDQLRAETEAIIQDIYKELTTVAKTLPRLRDTSKTTNMQGAIQTLKGAWLYSEETRELGKGEPPNLVPPEQKPILSQSPNLLESPQASQKDQESDKEESPKDGNTGEKDSGTEETKEQETENQGQDLGSNQCYKLQTVEFNSSDSSSSKSSHDEERKQPHQKSPSMEDEQEEEEPASIFRLATMAARARANQSKQETDIFT